MKLTKIGFFALSLLFTLQLMGQSEWTWTELDTMPQRISNNAVSEGINSSGDTIVYSFSGIDTSKTHDGISLLSFAYNYSNSSWSTLPDLPDTMGKIAAGASTINNKVYIIGGYHVLDNGNEVSSSKVHVFDPITHSYLPDAAEIPVAIDDQVQCTWRDSLIYVITGWSNTTNVRDVQIYDAANNNWLTGTPVPNQSAYRMFGASGTIIGDTIYYNGGVTSGFNFNAVPYLRKGIIDPNDPTQITWSKEEDNPGAPGYRMAATHYEDRCFWIGGAGTAYNYDGIAYNGSGGVEPLNRILRYEAGMQMWDEGLGAPYGVMDLRGIAQISNTSWIICGGMETQQQVSNKTYLLEYDPIAGNISQYENEDISLYPNPVQSNLNIDGIKNENIEYSIISSEGKILLSGNLINNQINVGGLSKGIYCLKLKSPHSNRMRTFIKL